MDTKVITAAIDHLKSGNIVLHATETCYGFTCDITNQAAVKQLFDLKKRGYLKPVSALFSSVAMAQRYVQWNETANQLAQKHLPGPLTIILPLREDAPSSLYPTPSGGGTIGVRISSHPTVLALVQQFNGPLVTTSANTSGSPCCYRVEDVLKQFGQYVTDQYTNLPFFVLEDTPLVNALPSTVVDCTNNKMTIVRNGVIEL